MRLLILDQFSDMGGAQQSLLELLPAIRERQWPALIAMPGAGEMFARVRALGFEAAAIACGPYASGRKTLADLGRFAADTPRLARQIRRLATRIDAGLLYLNGPRLLPAAALAGLRCPVLFHAHSYLPPGMIRRLAGRALGQLNARIVAQCSFVAEPWRQYVTTDRVSVIYNGVSGPRRARMPAPNAVARVGCIGRIAPEKGQREFVAAAALIHRTMPGCRFAVYGAALFNEREAIRYEALVRAEAATLPMDFAGWVDNVDDALASLDLLLVPSEGIEATTRVILEAFAAGLPVVAFRSGGIPEVVDHGVNGFLANSVEEMAEESVALLGDASRRAAMSSAARQTWEKRFTLERHREQMIRVLEGSSR